MPEAPTHCAATPERILEAVDHLNQCQAAGARFAILTAEDAAGLHLAVKSFVEAPPAGCSVVRVPAPTDSEYVFLQAILAQLGFDPFESTADDLQRLLQVVLRQAGARGAGVVIVVEDAQDFGPRVLEAIRELARNATPVVPPPLVVLTGHGGLHRVLDSRGMASIAAWTTARFDLATGRPSPAVAPATPAVSLVVSLNGAVVQEVAVDRPRLLVGRSTYCDVHLPGRFVSRQHALIVRNPDGDWIVDLKSTNGTIVNSQVTGQRRLDHGDVVAIGNYRIAYRNPAAAADRPAPARDPLGETVVMRSLQGLHAARDPIPLRGDPSSSAA